MPKVFEITLPIAGHAYLTIEAETEEEAIDKAFDEVTLDNIESWEAVRQFHQGNVCYCPRPWEAEAMDVSRDDEESAA